MTTLDIVIGTKKMTMDFKVVENVFSKIIIEIKSMKSNRIQIVPQEDCTYVQNERVNFVSKIRVSEMEN